MPYHTQRVVADDATCGTFFWCCCPKACLVNRTRTVKAGVGGVGEHDDVGGGQETQRGNQPSTHVEGSCGRTTRALLHLCAHLVTILLGSRKGKGATGGTVPNLREREKLKHGKTSGNSDGEKNEPSNNSWCPKKKKKHWEEKLGASTLPQWPVGAKQSAKARMTIPPFQMLVATWTAS